MQSAHNRKVNGGDSPCYANLPARFKKRWGEQRVALHKGNANLVLILIGYHCRRRTG